MRAVLQFLYHQFLGTLGVMISCGLMVNDVWPLVASVVGWKSFRPSVLLTEIPLFPLQGLTALLTGFFLAHKKPHSSMLWVWIVPSLLLVIVFFANDLERVSPLSYYFGAGCSPRNHCFVQTAVTLPFISSVAYSLGALLARFDQTNFSPR